tara:strand:+ start:1616 stop:3100 length:1485 start_codon:yes stop_codon:yes gene_type:complete
LSDAIIRGEGLTASEQRLKALAERTFLRLWSYPNTFNDRTKKASGGGQEFADLFAVFENHVVLFSDKEIGWQMDKPIELAWSRWYRRAIEGSITQLRGAERWLDEHPNRIFTDKACTQPLPVPLPAKEDRIVHLIAVASGAEAATRKYFDAPRGTLVLQSALKGAEHIDNSRQDFHPFFVGDVDPDGTFIHVFDPIGLDVVMKELDTVGDFTSYLVARARLLRSASPVIALGEEHLLAAYMMNGYRDGKPSFVPGKFRKKARRKQLIFPEGEYETYTGSALHAEIERLKRQSMLWDEMIELISEDVLKGTSISILDHEPSVDLSERGLRVMAAERRIDRLSLAQSLWGAMERCLDEGMARFVRRAIIARRKPSLNVGYVFLILPENPEQGSHADYRKYRSLMLSTYCLSLLREQPRLSTVVGLALDIFRRDEEIRTRSEDLVVMDSPDWTPDLLATLDTNKKAFDFKDPRDLHVRGTNRRIRNPFSVSARRFNG